MLRVRFHGRGGHGVKTASRILGRAAFACGWHVQDFPLFGAERRGAPLAAFTRIDTEPILERGLIRNPDLILIADETLLADAAAGALVGHEAASALFVNSGRPAGEIATQFAIACPVVAFDLTTAALATLGRGSALSAPLAAAACALASGIGAEHLDEAVREELGELSLSRAVIDKNVALARQVFTAIPPVTVQTNEPVSQPTEMVTPSYAGTPGGVPVLFHTGNAARRHTGSWRLFRPVIDRVACTRCLVCHAYCPDSAISLDANGYPVIDYSNCKGCMICQQACPVHCIHEVKEVRAW